MIVYRSFRIHSSRYLPNLDDDHICKKMHGHTFNITVYVKDSIDETIANKRYKKSFSATNTKGVAIAWIIFGVLIASYRYFSM